MDDFLKMAIASGLKFPIKKGNQRVIPDNVFGVFVGVTRSKHHALDKWPTDIHGCIGYWDPLYKTLNKHVIIDKIIKVAYDATWNDNRRNYFQHSLYVDLNAEYKIYFMLQPIMKIDTETGLLEDSNEEFNNKKYGIIVEDKNNSSQRATYLPDVFPNAKWDSIKKSLIKKASIDNNDIVFYAYNCDIYSMTLAEYFIKPFQTFIDNRYGNFVPYIVINEIAIVKKNEDVRNLATIHDILQMEEFGFSINENVKKSIIDNISYYKSKYVSNQNFSRQSSAFLLLDLFMLNKNDPYIDTIKNELINQLQSNRKSIDNNFELGEILMALIETNTNNETINNELIKITKMKDDTDNEINIFRYNWFSKLVNSMPNEYKYDLVNKILKFIDTYPYLNETNYLAVEFEALSTLYNSVSNETRLRIEPYLEKLLISLEQRKNNKGLYEFINRDARLDITGHILNGFYQLLDVQY
jgi:AMMECR1 domain-containing protein